VEFVVSYWEGWDAAARRTVGRLTTSAARTRDAAGEQYTILMEVAGAPWMFIDIAWNHYYCAAWALDAELRRAAQYQFRRLDDDRLFLTKIAKWRYANAAQPEFDARAGTEIVEIEADGLRRVSIAPTGQGGDLTQTTEQVPAERYRHPVPPFGDWRGVLAGDLESVRSATLTERPDPDVPGEPLPADQRPWRPPRPLRPSRPELMFRPGTSYDIPQIGRATVEVVEVGTLHLPTGRLVVSDPGYLQEPVHEPEAFADQVAPGEYPATVSVIRFDDNPDHIRVAAARLTILTAPVASWGLALLPGQDPRWLDDGQFFGFGVDSGTGCFVDAAAVAAIGRLAEDVYAKLFPAIHANVTVQTEPAANVVAFSSGWGDGAYPTWIGRTGAGRVACFVADLLVVHDAAVLT
jgi:hypothetical protein